jgi:hypothetical protein
MEWGLVESIDFLSGMSYWDRYLMLCNDLDIEIGVGVNIFQQQREGYGSQKEEYKLYSTGFDWLCRKKYSVAHVITSLD